MYTLADDPPIKGSSSSSRPFPVSPRKLITARQPTRPGKVLLDTINVRAVRPVHSPRRRRGGRPEPDALRFVGLLLDRVAVVGATQQHRLQRDEPRRGQVQAGAQPNLVRRQHVGPGLGQWLLLLLHIIQGAFAGQ